MPHKPASAIDLASNFTVRDMTRASARKAAVAALEEIAAKHGATVERAEHERETVLHLRLPRAYVMIDIDASTARVGAFLGHWNITHENKVDLFKSDWQAPPLGRRPHWKATTCCDLGFGVFLAHINQALRQVASGAAFVSPEG